MLQFSMLRTMINSKLQNIQALRGIAALLVLLAHIGGLGHVFPGLPTADFSWAAAGVDIFFVISGFIMYYVTRYSWGNITPFIASRITRVYPLWWICLCIEAPWIINYISQPPDEYFNYALRSFFLFPALNPGGELYPILVPGWTLMYEIFFYVLFSFIMLFERSNVSFKIFAVFSVIYACNLVFDFDPAIKTFLSKPIYIEFIFGILIAELLEKRLLHWRFIFKFGLFCIIMQFIFIEFDNIFFTPDQKFRFLYYGLPSALIVCIGLKLEADGFIAPKFSISIGNASYSIYLTQTLFISGLTPLLIKHNELLPGWMLSVTIALLSIAGGVITYWIIENPIFKITRYLIKKSKNILAK